MTVFVFVALPLEAMGKDDWVNPGTMGANALPTIPVEPPWAEAYSLVRVGAAAQWGKRNDLSFTPTFRLSAPFGKWVTLSFDGMPFEMWSSSPQTRAEWALPRNQGVAKGDIRFAVKVMLFDFGPRLPTIGARVLTKTTTGKDYDARRFIDAPAYLLELLVGERLHAIENLRIEVYAAVGFFAWQQGGDAQNDAIHLAVAGALQAWQRLNLEMQARAYTGWQKHDKPLVLALRVGVVVAPFLEIAATCNAGFIDAPKLEGRLDFNFRLPAVLPLVLKD